MITKRYTMQKIVKKSDLKDFIKTDKYNEDLGEEYLHLLNDSDDSDDSLFLYPILHLKRMEESILRINYPNIINYFLPSEIYSDFNYELNIFKYINSYKIDFKNPSDNFHDRNFYNIFEYEEYINHIRKNTNLVYNIDSKDKIKMIFSITILKKMAKINTTTISKIILPEGMYYLNMPVQPFESMYYEEDDDNTFDFHVLQEKVNEQEFEFELKSQEINALVNQLANKLAS